MSGRMLLSHNFDVSPDAFQPLNRVTFTETFQIGLHSYGYLECRQIDHPHWIVEILFPPDRISPPQVGELCAHALGEQRRSHHPQNAVPVILVLGGLKATPPTSSHPDALQSGEWGVDVVETDNAAAFLQKISWATMIAQRPVGSIFKVELEGA